MLFFAAGDAELEADAELFLVVEVVLFFEADEALVVDGVVVAASSFFWVWQPRNAVNISAVIKDKTDVFIFWLSLTNPRMSIHVAQSKHENSRFFPFKAVSFSRS